MAQPSHRDQLLDGAIRCLKTKGYSRTTARDIAAESGANLASIGYHFGSKETLLNTALIRILEQRNRNVGRLALQEHNSAGDGFVTAMFDAATGVFRAPRPLFVAFVEAIAEAERSPQLRREMAAHYRDARQRIADTLRANVDEGDSEVMATFILALFDGLMLQWLLDGDAVPGAGPLLAAMRDLARGADPGKRSRSNSDRGQQRRQPGRAR